METKDLQRESFNSSKKKTRLSSCNKNTFLNTIDIFLVAFSHTVVPDWASVEFLFICKNSILIDSGIFDTFLVHLNAAIKGITNRFCHKSTEYRF